MRGKLRTVRPPPQGDQVTQDEDDETLAPHTRQAQVCLLSSFLFLSLHLISLCCLSVSFVCRVVFIASAICLLSPHLSHSLPVSLSVFLVVFVSLSFQSFFQSFCMSFSVRHSLCFSVCIEVSVSVLLFFCPVVSCT
jgi:hypothetical protein